MLDPKKILGLKNILGQKKFVGQKKKLLVNTAVIFVDFGGILLVVLVPLVTWVIQTPNP